MQSTQQDTNHVHSQPFESTEALEYLLWHGDQVVVLKIANIQDGEGGRRAAVRQRATSGSETANTAEVATCYHLPPFATGRS